MKEVVDLYSKLVIGMFSFMGPSFTLLIPLFYKGTKFSKQKHADKLRNLKEVIAGLLLDNSFPRKVEETIADLKKKVRINETELNLLNPKRQVVRIFGSLLLAILFIGFYHFQGFAFLVVQKFFSKRFHTLSFSVLCLGYTIRVLWQVFCIIIETKIENEEEVEKINNLVLSKA